MLPHKRLNDSENDGSHLQSMCEVEEFVYSTAYLNHHYSTQIECVKLVDGKNYSECMLSKSEDYQSLS